MASFLIHKSLPNPKWSQSTELPVQLSQFVAQVYTYVHMHGRAKLKKLEEHLGKMAEQTT